MAVLQLRLLGDREGLYFESSPHRTLVVAAELGRIYLIKYN
jgi:hypothetical protein